MMVSGTEMWTIGDELSDFTADDMMLIFQGKQKLP